jgi:hypothetical protein
MLKREIRKKDKIIGLLKVHISSRKKKLEMKIIPSFFMREKSKYKLHKLIVKLNFNYFQ